MPLIDRIKFHAAHVANLTYGPSGDGHRFTVVATTPPLTEQRCVYFLLSHNCVFRRNRTPNPIHIGQPADSYRTVVGAKRRSAVTFKELSDMKQENGGRNELRSEATFPEFLRLNATSIGSGRGAAAKGSEPQLASPPVATRNGLPRPVPIGAPTTCELVSPKVAFVQAACAGIRL
jgi:hypothetical protein